MPNDLYPAGTLPQNDEASTSVRHNNAAMAPIRRHMSSARWEVTYTHNTDQSMKTRNVGETANTITVQEHIIRTTNF